MLQVRKLVLKFEYVKLPLLLESISFLAELHKVGRP